MKACAILVLAIVLASFGGQYHSGSQANSFAQASAPAAAAGLAPLALSAGTAFLANLTTDLEAGRCKVGDAVEAEAKQDVKQGHDVVLKKGSTLLGHVAAVHSTSYELTVATQFDSVRTKDGKQFSLPLTIQALAPEVTDANNGRLSPVWQSETARMRGTVINQLDTKSTGVYDFPHMNLSDKNSNGTHYSLITSSAGDFKLKKGSQLVMKVVAL
jgi:hypothetical protein